MRLGNHELKIDDLRKHRGAIYVYAPSRQNNCIPIRVTKKALIAGLTQWHPKMATGCSYLFSAYKTANGLFILNV